MESPYPATTHTIAHAINSAHSYAESVALARRDEAVSIAVKRAMSLVETMQTERQRIEDIRANHRNFNRMLTLIGAFVISLVLTFVLRSGILGSLGVFLAPYAFAITIGMDASFTIYAWRHRY